MSGNRLRHSKDKRTNLELSVSELNQVLKSLNQCRNIAAYRVSWTDLSDVLEDMLASLATSCRELSFVHTKLSPAQLYALLTAAQTSSTLTELELREENLSAVPPQVMTGCISRLRSAVLVSESEYDRQATAIVDEYTRDYGDKYIRPCPPLPTDSLGAILIKGIQSNTTERMILGKIHLQTLSTGKNLTCSTLDEEELKQVFTVLLTQTCLRGLTIKSFDLSFLDEETLSQGFARIRCLDLSNTSLTPTQLTTLFNLLKDSEELEELVLRGSLLSHVPADDLARTLSRLRKVRLEYSYLTTEQCMQLLTAALDETNNNLELLKFGAFSFSWRDGQVLSSTLPTQLAEIVGKAKMNRKFEFEFQDFSESEQELDWFDFMVMAEPRGLFI